MCISELYLHLEKDFTTRRYSKKIVYADSQGLFVSFIYIFEKDFKPQGKFEKKYMLAQHVHL